MNIKPEIGMGVTICHYTDRDPGTIIRISPSGKQIVIQEDKAIRTDNNGMSESQSYVFERNPNGEIRFATLRKDGKYRLTGQKAIVSLGSRARYYDYSF